MKKVLVFFLVFIGAASVCCADDCSMPVLVSAPDTNTVHTASGTVESVSIADSLKGLRSEIVIGEASGRRHVLIVKATTTIYDPVWKPIGLEILHKNDSVKVKYITTGEGLAEALSIKKLQQ